MKMRFAGQHVPVLLCWLYSCMYMCQCVCLGHLCVCVWSLMSAGGCYCSQIWALGNHKTQSLWSIPELLPLYIAFSSSTHTLSHTHIFFCFPLFSISPLPLTLPISVLHLILPHSLYLCVLLYITALCCLSLVSVHFSCHLFFPPCSSTRCPRALHSPIDSSCFPSLSAPLLPPHPPTSLVYPCRPLLLPFAFHHMRARCWRGSIDCTLGWQAW